MFDFSGVVQQLQNQKVELESQLQKVNSAVAALKGVGNKNGGLRVASGPSRVISVAARKRIAAAQKARWAKWRASKKKAA